MEAHLVCKSGWIPHFSRNLSSHVYTMYETVGCFTHCLGAWKCTSTIISARTCGSSGTGREKQCLFMLLDCDDWKCTTVWVHVIASSDKISGIQYCDTMQEWMIERGEEEECVTPIDVYWHWQNISRVLNIVLPLRTAKWCSKNSQNPHMQVMLHVLCTCMHTHTHTWGI